MSIPGAASPLFLAATAAGPAAGFEISRSLRFNTADSSKLSRTPSSASNRKTWTMSYWVKRARIGEEQMIFSAAESSSNRVHFYYPNSDLIAVYSHAFYYTLQDLARDPGAWMHLVFACDTTQSTDTNRFKIYKNGVLVDSYLNQSHPAQNLDTTVNGAFNHQFSGRGYTSADYADAYLADVNFVDGAQLEATSFGALDDNGVWQAIDTSGLTFGTNGFRLQFADNSGATATTLGKDTSGNSNNFTPNNLSVAAGAGNDSLVDSPTNGTQTDSGAGGQVVGCYSTWNPLSGNTTLSNGNLDSTGKSGHNQCLSTIGMSSGKYYCEITITDDTNYSGVGIGTKPETGSFLGNTASGYLFYSYSGNRRHTGVNTSYGSSFTTGDIIGIAFDADGGNLYFYKNGTIQDSGTAAFTGLTSGPYFFAVDQYGTNHKIVGNFGQRVFAYTNAGTNRPSADYKCLNTANLPTPTIADGSKYFDTKLYTGNGGTQTLSGLGFSPDMVWFKNRTSAVNHHLLDTVRGANNGDNVLYPNLNNAEGANSSLTAFTSDGFTVGSNDSVNKNNNAIAAWAWDAGTSTVTNDAGSIDSQVRANTSAGFSIVTYTGASGNQSIGHSLNAKPKFILIKNRSNSADWFAMFDTGLAYYQHGYLNGTSQFYNATDQSVSTTTITLGNNSSMFGAVGDNYVAYCFAPVAGYSAMGTYTGNGDASGPFVYTGMKPAWVMVKRTNAGNDWAIWDNARNKFNETSQSLFANLTAAEDSGFYDIDILSNGFKLRHATTKGNGNGSTYIYIAFASNPFASNGGLAR